MATPGPLPFKSNRSAKWNCETEPVSRSSFSVQPAPVSRRGSNFGRSATNPDNVGVSDPDIGHSSAD